MITENNLFKIAKYKEHETVFNKAGKIRSKQGRHQVGPNQQTKENE